MEKLGELELYNLREKLTEIQAADLKELEARYNEVVDSLRADKAELEGYLKEKDRIREEERKDHERNVQELNDKIRER